jgi:hypothetical protein
MSERGRPVVCRFPRNARLGEPLDPRPAAAREQDHIAVARKRVLVVMATISAALLHPPGEGGVNR